MLKVSSPLIESGYLFIDPGLMGTGWAYYSKLDGKQPKDSGVFRTNETEWINKAHDINHQVFTAFHLKPLTTVTIEMPGLWLSGKSMASATSGDLFKLTYLVGALGVTLKQYCSELKLVSPQEWKGQLPKDVVIRRINKVFPTLVVRNHEADAVAMGMAAQGLL